jgi:assimilatory nitrate reductase catalytic subunit
MGGREVGGLANQLAAHMSFADPADIDRVRRFWQAPRMATRPGLKAIDLFDAVLDGRVKALWILGTNPAASVPRAGRVRAALAACPIVVVSDCWATDTTSLARIVLPAAGWGEKDGTVTNSERRISRQRPFRAAPGEARPDWWMLAEAGRRMGWKEAFGYDGSAAIFREHAALSAFENDGRRVFDIGALADLPDAEYDALAPVQWPVARGGARVQDGRLFADGAFATPGGKARLVPTPWRPPAEAADCERPLVLNTGRTRDQWHTMTRTGLVPRLMAHAGEPLLDLSPTDASRHGLADGALAHVESRHGAAVLRVRISADQRPGEAFAPMHWTDRFASSGSIDRLVGAATDPVSGQPEMKATPIRVAPVTTFWRALLLRREDAPLADAGCHWARVPVASGQAFELSGTAPLPGGAASEAWVAALLAASAEAELVIYADPRRGIFRYASVVEGRLDACLFIARGTASLPERAALEAMLGAEIEPDDRAALLAGGRPSGARPVDAGRTVCACFAVGVTTLRDAIRDQRLATVAEIGAALRAGTNCGSCIPELKDLLRDESAARDAAEAA